MDDIDTWVFRPHAPGEIDSPPPSRRPLPALRRALVRAAVGGRTTWLCPVDQPDVPV